MKILPFLIFLSIFVAVYGLDRQRIEQARERGRGSRLRERFGQLTPEKKKELWKAIGQDPEIRRNRLEKFQNRRRGVNITEEQKQEIKEKLAQIVPVKLTEDDNDDDLFEVNNKEGVSQYLFEGDINLSDDQLTQLESVIDQDEAAPGYRVKRQASSVFRRWSDNTVFFFFDGGLNERKRNSIRAGNEFIRSRTCINFVESSNAANRIRVFNGNGCFATIGMNGGQQELSLGDGCEVIGTAVHEMAHALGIWHTQMRSDRDDHVTVDVSAVPNDLRHNFNKLNANQNFIYTPYEYGSSMHYHSNAFTNPSSRLSVIPRDTAYTYTMGSTQISFYDIIMINRHYNCDARCPAASSARCRNGGMPNPRNCAVCNCPAGYAGNLCDQRPAGCGETLTANANWQSRTFEFGEASNQATRDTFTYCNHWIQAPAGQMVQTRITSMFNPQCRFGCPFNGIEIKGVNTDQRMTNPRYCCEEFNNRISNSTLNPTPIISYNRFRSTRFTIEYRAVPRSG